MRGEKELRANVRDLLVDSFTWQSLFHDSGNLVLQKQPVDTAHHDNTVERHEENGHLPAETKTAVQDNERDGEKREPDVSAHPALHRADRPEHHSFAQTEQRAEDENRKRNRPENQTDGSATNAPMFRWLLHERGGQTEERGQTRRIKIPDVNPAGGDCREDDKSNQGTCARLKDSHRVIVSIGEKVLHAGLSWRSAPEYSSGVFREELLSR